MDINIFAHAEEVPNHAKVGNAVVNAKRTKHKGFDVFKLFGTNQDGAPFEINIFLDNGQKIAQSIEVAGEYGKAVKGNPANGYKKVTTG